MKPSEGCTNTPTDGTCMPPKKCVVTQGRSPPPVRYTVLGNDGPVLFASVCEIGRFDLF